MGPGLPQNASIAIDFKAIANEVATAGHKTGNVHTV
jgi:hypothetical protein